jgi:Rieske Fe-S protein
MPTLSAMLAKTAAATEAYTAWVDSADTPADRRLLATAVHAADDTLGSALARVQERWRNDPNQWLTLGMTLAMSQRILAEVGHPLDPEEREPA